MKKIIRIIGMPMDLGQSRRGVDMGPSAIRYAGLSERLRCLGYEVEDIGNIQVPVRDAVQEADGVKFLSAIREACEKLYEAGKDAIAQDRLPIFLGGDHSMSIGTIGGVTHASPSGVIWIDAHGDFNLPETSPSGNIHGMPLAILTARGYPELVDLGRPGAKIQSQDIVLIGIRELDLKERALLKESGVVVYTMRDIDERGIAAIAREALQCLRHLSRIHVSLDIDGLDPNEAPGAGTLVPGGLTYREAHLLMEIFSDSRKIGSMDIVEINPILDERNKTATIAVEMAASLLGAHIL